MLSFTLLLALVATHSTFITAAPYPDGEPQSAINAKPGTALYTITSASIHQYDGPLATRRLKGRQASNAQATNPDPLGSSNNSTAASNSSALPQIDSGPYTPPPPRMEDFNLTVFSGASTAGNPIFCNLTWDAGQANSATRDHIASQTFTCAGGQTNVRMERRNVTPLYGFYIFVQMQGSQEAAWMVKDLGASPGWTNNGGDHTFNGTAYLTQVPNQTLADFLGAS